MLDPLLNPKTIAVIGASRTPGKVGHEIVANLVSSQFEGAIIPVNPSAEEILGIRCYPEVKAYSGTIDLSIVVVPSRFVLPAVESSLDAEAKAICVISAGFREIGPEGVALEEQVVRACRSRGARLLGPNCLGLINVPHNMNASFAAKMPQCGNISVISQSGALCTAILDWAASQKIGLSKLISIGNKADIDENDLVKTLAEDESTKVIVGYLESITSGEKFIRSAEVATSKKPVVVLKSGTTSAGVKAASSHTGSLAGADIAYGAAFMRSGVIRADTFETLFDYAKAFSMQPLPAGNRVAIVTNAGGPGIMAADAAEKAGLEVATLDEENAKMLKKELPAAASVANPIDVLGDAGPESYGLAASAALADPNIDAVVVVLTPQAMTNPLETAREIQNAANGEKPLLASFMGGEDVCLGREELTKFSIPDYTSPERAVAALKAMNDYASWQRRPARIVDRFPVNRRRVKRIISRNIRKGQLQVGEVPAKEIMRAYGFVVPQGQLASSVEEAVDTALKIGLPVAMKIVSPDIVHKSDLGGVKINLATLDAVKDAYELMMLRIGRAAPGAVLEGVYLEEMCPRGREVIIGMTRDPQFGPMLMFGLGGIFVEVMKDVTFHLAPITAQEALQMLKKTKSYTFLEGVRGHRAVDVVGIASAIQRISQLVTDFPEIAELDINPLIVGEVGSDCVVADARITLSKKG